MLLLALFVMNDFLWVGGYYDQLCCQASPKLLLGLALGLSCDKIVHIHKHTPEKNYRNLQMDNFQSLSKNLGNIEI